MRVVGLLFTFVTALLSIGAVALLTTMAIFPTPPTPTPRRRVRAHSEPGKNYYPRRETHSRRGGRSLSPRSGRMEC